MHEYAFEQRPLFTHERATNFIVSPGPACDPPWNRNVDRAGPRVGTYFLPFSTTPGTIRPIAKWLAAPLPLTLALSQFDGTAIAQVGQPSTKKRSSTYSVPRKP